MSLDRAVPAPTGPKESKTYKLVDDDGQKLAELPVLTGSVGPDALEPRQRRPRRSPRRRAIALVDARTR